MVRLLTVVVMLAWQGMARGHALDPALLDVRETAPGLAEVLWRTAPTRAALDPVLPEGCRAISPPVTADEETTVSVRWSVDCRPDGWPYECGPSSHGACIPKRTSSELSR